MNDNTKILDEIYQDLQNGYIYGEWNEPPRYRWRVFHAVLYLTTGDFIGWTHAGSSANKNTIEDLDWIITVIFGMTPDEFKQKYIRKEA